MGINSTQPPITRFSAFGHRNIASGSNFLRLPCLLSITVHHLETISLYDAAGEFDSGADNDGQDCNQ